jgi:hypothetical protein
MKKVFWGLSKLNNEKLQLFLSLANIIIIIKSRRHSSCSTDRRHDNFVQEFSRKPEGRNHSVSEIIWKSFNSLAMTLKFIVFCNILMYVTATDGIWMAPCNDPNILKLGALVDLVFLDLCFPFWYGLLLINSYFVSTFTLSVVCACHMLTVTKRRV